MKTAASSRSRVSRVTKVVKFIVTRTGKIILGDRDYRDDFHRALAYRSADISGFDVCGGGLADLKRRRIFGTSYDFGPYDPKMVRRRMRGWRVEEPSAY